MTKPVARAPLEKFTRFLGVGALGMLVDATVFSAMLIGFGLHHGLGRVVASWAAMSATWLLNRRYVFVAGGRSVTGEYFSYLASSAMGAFANLLSYLAFHALFPQLGHVPPYVIGAIIGLFVNFLLYDRVTFRDTNQSKS